MSASTPSPAVRHWILSLATPFSACGVEDFVVAADPAAIHDYVVRLSDDELRSTLVREITQTLAARRPWEATQLIIRLTSVVRAGRMPPHEAWPVLLRVGRLMQTTFSSWSEYGDALIVDFDGVTDRRSSCIGSVSALLKDDGAWTRLPWDLALGDVNEA